jgi:hypothetical protein
MTHDDESDIFNVSDIFWEFCKAATSAKSLDEFKETEEYESMNEAVGSGKKLAIAALHPLQRNSRSLYVFDGINELFDGVRKVLDPHATVHRFVLESCMKRISIHIDTEEFANGLSKI